MSAQCLKADLGKPERTFVSLQYLRAIAAFMVIYFHAVLQLRLVGRTAVFPLLGQGGVDIFFTLSGFMMWYTTERSHKTTLGAFMARRIVRVVPLYWAVTSAALCIACVMPSLLRSTLFDLPHAVASLFFVPWRNPAVAAIGGQDVLVPVVVPGWTLNFEMIFYLFFALTLRFTKALRLPILFLLLLSLYAVSGMAGKDAPLSFYHKDMLFEFLAGSALGAAHMQQRAMSGRFALMLGFTGFAALLGLEAAGSLPVPRIVLFGIPAVSILIAALRAEAGGAVPVLALLDRLGNASFSIYLTHGFVLAGLRGVAIRLGLNADGPIVQGGFILAALILSADVGLAVYHRIEQPLVRFAGRLLPARHVYRRLQAA